MASSFRQSSPVCLGISILNLLTGKLRLSNQYVGRVIETNGKQKFTIFRQININPHKKNENPIVFIVRFRFAHLSHNANKIASIIPMLLISGFPGFDIKLYAVNHSTGYWQGMYQWKSIQALSAYKKSFVYRMMNKRAINNTISSEEYDNKLLSSFINENKELQP